MITIDSPITGERETLTEAQFNSYISQTNGAIFKWVVDGKLELQEKMEKHGTHDQKTHGSWANSSGVVEDINAWNKSEQAKFASPEAQELYLIDKMMSQGVNPTSEFKGVVASYQSRLGYVMNEALRDNMVSEDGVQGVLDRMDAAIASARPIPEPMTVYRGVKGNGLDFFESLKAGDVFEDKGYSSTSLDTNIAAKFSSNSLTQGIVLKMNLPAGTKGLFPMSITGMTETASREAEFILPRGSKYRVLNREGRVWDVEVVND